MPSWRSTGTSQTGMESLHEIIFGSWLLTRTARPTNGISSTLISKHRCWVNLLAAEWNWKQVKAVKSGQRVNTSIDKTRKQVLIYAQYQQMHAQARAMKLSEAGKLWDDKDFEGLKMDVFCKEIQMSLEDKKFGSMRSR